MSREVSPSNPSSNPTTPGLMVKTAADIGKAVTRFPGLGKDLFVLKTAYDVLAAENERLRAALENASRRSEYWKAEHAEANRAIEALEARLAPETPGSGMSMDETRFYAALSAVKPPKDSPGGMTEYGRTLIERVDVEYRRLKEWERTQTTSGESHG